MHAESQDTRATIVYQARQAYWEFYYRDQVDRLLQEVQARWKTINQVLQAKELSGQWLSVKTVRLQMETAKAVNGLITNSRGLRVSQFNLNHLFSLPHFTAYRLEGDAPLPVLTAKEEDLVQQALRNNPEIRTTAKAIEAQESRRTLALMDHLPDLTLRLSGTRDPQGNGFSDYGFRLGLSVPVFFAGKQTQELDAASDELSAVRYDLQGKRNEVIHMVEEAYVNAESTGRLLKLYEDGGLRRQVEKAWQAAQVEYRNEEMPLSDYVMTYNSYVETLTSYYQAQADYGKALAELDYRVGGMKGDSK
jgi:cobalt-zinc-cadmium efflux system outer membrane protein